MNYNPQNFKAGDVVLIDKGYSTQLEVVILVMIKPTMLFARVKNTKEDGEKIWEVLTNRLTRIKN